MQDGGLEWMAITNAVPQCSVVAPIVLLVCACVGNVP